MKLTSYTKFSGCGAKLGPGILDKALCGLTQPVYPNLLTDFSHAEDAGVYKLNDSLAIAQTVDFFPPIVDDPFTFGRIAAANALSDLYAMGAQPISALAIVAFPLEQMELDVLAKISEGGLSALTEAGAALLGGHSVEDEELKIGYAVTGTIHPDKILENNGAKAGDKLIFTKKIGTGVVNRAIKTDNVSEEAVKAANESMQFLNKYAAEILTRYKVNACTDVTGFGFIGHSAEMIRGTGLGLNIDFSQFQFLPGAVDYANMKLFPAGAKKNRNFTKGYFEFSESIPRMMQYLLFDPQTSGGLLAAVSPEDADEAMAELKQANIPAQLVGEFVKGREIIHVE